MRLLAWCAAWLLLAPMASAAPTVRECGAKGDGKANDTAAFARALAQGLDVTIPPGRYRVGPLTLPTNCRLRGVGPSSVLLPATPGQTVLRLSAGCTVADLRMEGGGSAAPAIYGVWKDGRYLEDCRVEHVVIADFKAFGINLDHAARTTIAECDIEQVTRAIELDFCREIRVVGNRVRNCSEHGIQFWGNWQYEQQVSSDLTFVGNHVTDGGGGAIWGTGARRVVMSANTVVRCKDVGLDLEWCGDSSITGNAVTGALNAGISCFCSCDNVTITGNSVVVTPQAGGLNYGIWLTDTNRKAFKGDTGHQCIAITGNSIRCEGSMPQSGIWISDEVENVVVAANVLRGCVERLPKGRPAAPPAP